MGFLRKAIVCVAALLSVEARADTWTLGNWYQYSGNGAYYSVQAITGATNGWLIANAQAQELAGPNGAAVTLASITSAELDRFIFDGVDTQDYWTIDSAGNNEGPNIGGYQTDKLAEPAGHWAWKNGDTWSYTQWAPSEPTNGGNTEDYATLFCNGGRGCRSGNWNDIGSDTSPVGTQGSIHFYIAESTGVASTPSVPEPASWAMMVGGFGLIGGAMRRQKKVAATFA